ncbi:unnamed protein product, partial [marine sediment metagenome]
MDNLARQHILAVFISILLILCVFSPFYNFPIQHAGAAGWWDTDFDYCKTITIDHDYIDGTLTNFPILVVIDDTTADKCNGGDSIRFIHSDETTEFYYEIEKWVDNEDRIVWVNVTSITHDVDTLFRMYYGNDGASDDQNPTDVWDSNYKLVCHFDDPDTGTSVDDSTVNENDGTKKSNTEPERTASNMGYGLSYTGTPSDDYINWGNIGDTCYGMSYWIKPGTTITKDSPIAESWVVKSGYLYGVYGASTGLLVDEVFCVQKALDGDTREGITN